MYRSELFIPSVGMVIASWSINQWNEFIILSLTGVGDNCIMPMIDEVPGFYETAIAAIKLKTHSIKLGMNHVKQSQTMLY